MENTKVENILKTAKGQIDTILKMVNDERQCTDILTQVLALQGLVRRANLMILENHMKNCLSCEKDNDDYNQKIDEIMKVFKSFLK